MCGIGGGTGAGGGSSGLQSEFETLPATAGPEKYPESRHLPAPPPPEAVT